MQAGRLTQPQSSDERPSQKSPGAGSKYISSAPPNRRLCCRRKRRTKNYEETAGEVSPVTKLQALIKSSPFNHEQV